MVFETATYTSPGGKKVNEDGYIVDENMWIIADGLGGHNSGEMASQICIRKIQQSLSNSDGTIDFFQAINEANKAIIENQKLDRRYRSMRATTVAAMAYEDKLEYANIGDSRFYYLENGKISHHSDDQSVSALSAKLGEIAFEDIRNDAGRYKLLQIIGDSEAPLNTPHNVFHPKPGDAFILCTDGFWEYVYEQEMEIDFLKSQSALQWIEFMVKRVILKTYEKNNDNFTVIAVMVK